MTKGHNGGALVQLAGEFQKGIQRIDKAIEELGRRHDVNREDGLAEWCSRNALLVLRWLGDTTEIGAHFNPSSVWLEDERSMPPPAEVSEAITELPNLLDSLLGQLNPIFSEEAISGSTRKPKLQASIEHFNQHRNALDLAIFKTIREICRIREYHVLRLDEAIHKCYRAIQFGDGSSLGSEPGEQLIVNLPISRHWNVPPAASGKYLQLEPTCRNKLEPVEGVSSGDLRLSIFAQVGCGESLEFDDEGQWEGFTVRICVSVDDNAKSPFDDLQLTVSTLSPGCEMKSIRTTLESYDEEVWHESSEIRVLLPPIQAGHQHDILILGHVRSVGLVEIVIRVGAAPWTLEDHRRLRIALATAAGVEAEHLRFAEVGDVQEDGCASVHCAFPDHPKPRAAQSTLLSVLSDCKNPGDRGLPYSVSYFGPAQPTIPDMNATLTFRSQMTDPQVTPPRDRNNTRGVAFNTTKDVGDTVMVDVCLAERWGFHSGRVREEVFRQNLCTILSRVNGEISFDSDHTKWHKELAKTVTSPLYDHPLSELRQTLLVKELLWIALGGVVKTDDPGERKAIIASLRAQKCVVNPQPINTAPECRHSLYTKKDSHVISALHLACLQVNDELQRMNKFLDATSSEVPNKELATEEESERLFISGREEEARSVLLKNRKMAPKELRKRSKGTVVPQPAVKSVRKATPSAQTPKRVATKTPTKSSPTPTRNIKSPPVRKPPAKKAFGGGASPKVGIAENQTPSRKKKVGKANFEALSMPSPRKVTPKSMKINKIKQEQNIGFNATAYCGRQLLWNVDQPGYMRSHSATSTGSRRGRMPHSPEGLSSLRSQFRTPTPKSRRRKIDLERPPTADEDLQNYICGREASRSPSPSFASSRRSSRWLAGSEVDSLHAHSELRGSAARFNRLATPPPSLLMETPPRSPRSSLKAQRLQNTKTDSVLEPWLANSNATPSSELQPPSPPLSTQVTPSSGRSRISFKEGDRICVKCGVEIVKDIFRQTRFEWRDALERFVGCPGVVVRVDPDIRAVEIHFDSSVVRTHDPRQMQLVWPVESVESESTSPVPTRRKPINSVSDPPPSVLRRRTQK